MQRILVVVAVAVSLVSGCSEDGRRESLHSVEPATPVASPETAQTPAGTVDTASRPTQILFDAKTKTLVTLTDGRLSGFDNPITDAATIQPGPPGEIIATAKNRVAYLSIPEGIGELINVEGDVLSAVALPDGRTAVGTADGAVLIYELGLLKKRITGFVSVDALVVVGDSLIALDRRQSMLVEVNIDSESHGLALRTGQGAAQLATDHWGRIFVTDPRTKQLTVFSANPLMMRQRIPTGAAPYAVAYDDKREIAWVTLTETNEVVGYDLSTGTAREVHRYPTVRQPNAITVDPETGAIFVAGEQGMQRIPV